MRRHPGMNRKVLVSLISGSAVSGVLTKTPGPLLILQGAMIHEPGAEPAAADGEIVIDGGNVDYVQIVGGG
jgi:small nuclear ribonucleoprotein (snRNP)-like protein